MAIAATGTPTLVPVAAVCRLLERRVGAEVGVWATVKAEVVDVEEMEVEAEDVNGEAEVKDS
jgi:hypothetical protein